MRGLSRLVLSHGSGFSRQVHYIRIKTDSVSYFMYKEVFNIYHKVTHVFLPLAKYPNKNLILSIRGTLY